MDNEQLTSQIVGSADTAATTDQAATCSQTQPPDRKDAVGSTAVGQDGRKRSWPGESCTSEERPGDMSSLDATQKGVLQRLIQSLDKSSSVVITNPQRQNNPIVYVTRPWEGMCGYSYAEALGQNPRITQGENSDRHAIQGMSTSLASRRSCKVMMLNYRGGHADQPFFNMLSISPVTHQGQLMFFLANLQDYSYHMSRLVTLPPTQFCRAAEHHQRIRLLTADSGRQHSVREFARPAVIETDELSIATPSCSPVEPHMQMKALGWNGLELEAEYLTDRIADVLATMEARYERVDRATATDDCFVINVDYQGVACAVVVTHDPTSTDARHRVSCRRLGGDTFAYHAFFRQMRELLGDAVEGGVPIIAPARQTPANRLAQLRLPLRGGGGEGECASDRPQPVD